jgi:small GTP-binding protein
MADIKSWKMKMCLIGDAAVGKTSLIHKFVLDRFDDTYIATLGTKTSKKTILVSDGRSSYHLTLMIWDVLGQKHFDNLQKVAYQGANGAFIVLDLTRKETLESFGQWLQSLYEVAGVVPVVVIANKNDLSAEFGEEEISDLVAEYGFPYYFTSAKTGDNVNAAFRSLGKSMVSTWGGNGGMSTPVVTGKTEGSMDTRSKDRLSILQAEDRILTMYCSLLGDTEIAMAIIRAQFKRAGMDFKNPTLKGLEKVVEYLLNAASEHVDPDSLEKEKRAYRNIIGRIG